ncbi:ABC transporter ATP-binding protein [Vibrio fluvialis]|uniref:ABC transporter ATP-binding protein n=1 Tax=Vibrio fluvialis TaxID=676 RepID=UPI00301C3FEC
MTDLGISLNNVGLTFEGASSRYDSLITRWAEKRRGNASNRNEGYKIDALQGININISSGERVGLIGLNGAGKSTLLKVMAGIYPPSTGEVQTRGHVCPLFEFATGFEMNQSGWDNIRIRGMLLGMLPEEIDEKLPEIATFTELGEFLDYPVRTYSSGMFIRLAFAVSTSIKPEILLIDEVMGAGDISFAEKAKRRMFDFISQGKVLVFTTHNFALLGDFCERTIWLEKGKVVADDKTEDIIEVYQKKNSRT